MIVQFLRQIWQAVSEAVLRLIELRKDVRELKDGHQRIENTLQRIEDQLEQVLDALLPGPAVELILCAELEGETTIGVTMVNLRIDQTVRLFIKPVDKKGNPAVLDGVPVWSTSNSEVATLAVAEDGLSAVLTPVGPLGSCVVSLSADADMGSGVKPLSAATDVQVSSGAAVTLEIQADTPVDTVEGEGGPTPGARARRTR